MTSSSKNRLDQTMVDQGLLATRAMARSWIMAGNVFINQQRADKPGTWVKPGDVITMKDTPRFVSRGGEKLAFALQAFNLNVTQGLCLDVGASTGGFTDCLLQAGARHVVAVDVGTNQLDWRLRHHAQVTVVEQTHIRDFDRLALPLDAATGFDWIVADVSFISLLNALPHILPHAKPGTGQLITLLKPQFEYGRYVGDLRRFNGVVSHPADLRAILDGFFQEAEGVAGWTIQAMAVSPLKGAKGNTEYLLWWTMD
jgi:23S rRNA (cytidine1920-2'-O)/16S rRNA (cytidine1409-2'-O)-methyltransferase